MGRLWSLGLGLVMLVVGSAEAQGGLFGGTTAYGPSDGFNIGGNYVASSFSLATDAGIQGVTFATNTYLVGMGPGPDVFPGSLDWTIFAGSGATPSSVVASGVVTPVTSSPASNTGSQVWSFGTPDIYVHGATRYWLGLRTDDGADSGLRWNTAYYDDQCNANCVYQAPVPAVLGTGPTDGSWIEDTGDFHQFAFGLQGESYDVTTTPESSSLALLGTGMLGIIPFARRRLRAKLG